jgi:hypothetical protein
MAIFTFVFLIATPRRRLEGPTQILHKVTRSILECKHPVAVRRESRLKEAGSLHPAAIGAAVE